MNKQTILPPVRAAKPSTEAQIADLAKRYIEARGVAMKLLEVVGKTADGLLDQLPVAVRSKLDAAAVTALEGTFSTAAKSRDIVPDTGDWLTRAMTAGTGAVGGFGGLPTAMAELPVTTTIFHRAIQSIAVEYGFDPNDKDTRLDCLQVFGAAGPLNDDDDTDLGFLSLRMSMAESVKRLVALVGPRLAAVLGQKLAMQSVPVLGAVAGAAVNYTFTQYYQDMAHVHFGLRKLSEDTGEDRAALIEKLSIEMDAQRRL
jgi:hypothetical protein